MAASNIAQNTLGILDEGCYVNSSGKTIELGRKLQAAIKGTVLYTPEQGRELLTGEPSGDAHGDLAVQVTAETTQVAAHRLVHLEGRKDLVLLNYASARNPGGGFINGAKAQGEDLTRCSGLYPCLLTQPGYYEANRQNPILHTDYLIYSPAVPWFRTRRRTLLDKIFLASVITASAPNAEQAVRRDPEAWSTLEETVRHRAGLVLAVARAHGHRNLLLGAWGLGPLGYAAWGQSVFRNRPEMVADAFGAWLESPTFAACFDHVAFGIPDRSRDRQTLRAFQERFPES